MWSHVEQALNQSTVRVLSGIAQLLPGLVAMIISVLLAAFLAWLLRVFLRRALKGVEFDAWLGRWGLGGLADWSPSKSPTLLVTRVVSWGVILIGFLVGITAFDATLTSKLALQAFGYIPDVLAAVLVLVVGIFVAGFLARSVLIGAVNLNLEYARFLSAGVRWLVLILTAAMALDHLGVGKGIVDLAFAILFGGIVLTLALAIGLGSKDMVSRSLERRASQPPANEDDGLQHL
jgi:Mechanosensitive ion channel, conserved TM helix